MIYFLLYIIGGWATAYALLRKNSVDMNNSTGEEGSEVIVGAVAAIIIWPLVLGMWAWHSYKESL